MPDRAIRTKLFYPGPNPSKVALLLEELEEEYRVIPVDTWKGEQFAPDFVAINPNSKLPALVDGDVKIFDSGAILLYLAEKHGRFLGADTSATRGELLSWLLFVASGVGPFAGQAAHFRFFAPEPRDYALNRYLFEAERHFTVLENRLAGREWMLGADYSIVDMAVWGWAQNIHYVLDQETFDRLPNVKRLLDQVNSRPAAERAAALPSKFTFKQDMDEEFRRNMLRHLEQPQSSL